MADPDERIINVAEAAEILGVSIATVARWAESGKLPAIRKLPGRTGVWIFNAKVVRLKAAEELLDKAG